MPYRSYESWLKVSVIVLLLYLLLTVTNIYFPVIVSIILTFILNPVVTLLTEFRVGGRTIRMPRSLAVFLSFLFAVMTLGILGTFVVLPFIHEFDKFIMNLPALLIKMQDISGDIELWAHSLEIPFNVNTLVQQGVASAATFTADLAKRMIQALFSLVSSIVQLVVVPVLTYYFLKDWLILKEKIIQMFSVESRGRARRVIDEMGTVISGYIRGQVLVSLVIGLMVFCGMYIMKIDYPLVLGLLAACTETIPIVGPIVGAVPAIMLAYLVSPALALKAIIFYIVIHQLENHIVVPNIMGHVIDLHPVIIIISLLIGGQLLGIVGMMLAVPVAALLKVMIRQLWSTTER